MADVNVWWQLQAFTAPLVQTSTTYRLANGTPGTSIVFTGTGFTYDENGIPTGGVITSVSLVIDATLETPEIVMTTLTGLDIGLAEFGAHILTDLALRSQISWANVLNDEPDATLSPTLIRAQNLDGTFTDIIGSGFDVNTPPGSELGTVTSIRHVAADGVTLLSTVPVNITLPQAAAALFESYAGERLYLLLQTGDTTVTGVNTTIAVGADFYSTQLVDGPGNDILDGGSNPGSVDYEFATSGVTLNLGTGQATGGGGSDTLVNIRFINGSVFGDTMIGNDQDNSFFARGGDDFLFGGLGNDVLEGREGNDTLDGGAGIDQASYAGDEQGGVTVSLAIAGPQDTINSGIDTLISIENLRGTDFNDTLTGNGLSNILSGAFGDDILEGGAGTDFVFGDEGDDVLVVSPGSVLGGEVLNGGDGTDTLRLTGGQSGMTTGIGIGGAQLVSLERIEFATSGAVSAVFLFNQLAALSTATIVGSSNADNVRFLAVGGGTYSLAGTSFTFENWDDGQNLEPENVEIFVRAADYLYLIAALPVGGSGNFNLTGSSGRDWLVGHNFNDVLVGGDGSDIIESLLGVDQLYGGDGNDALVVYGGVLPTGPTNFDEDYSLETYDGGAGRDFLTAVGTVNFNGTLTSIEGFAFATSIDSTLNIDWATVDAMPDAIEVIGTSGFTALININVASASTVDLSAWRFANNYWRDGIDRVTVNGSSGNDTITGTTKSDTLSGGLGDDLLNGGTGSDFASYAGAASGVTVNVALAGAQNTGGAGLDTLVSIENLTGSGFNDTLTGSVGENVLDGGLGDDVLAGGAGDDMLNDVAGSLGAASINAGTGNDAITLTGAFLSGTVNGSVGTDQVTVSGDISGLTFLSVEILNAGAGALTGTAAQFRGFQTIQRSPDDLTGRVTLVLSTGGILNLTNKTPDRAATVTGSATLDVITGSVGDDVLDGGSGGDTLNGGDGNDTLTGGDGPDTINGGNGADIIDGGTGNDILAGGTGDDVITDIGGNAANISGGTGNDIITIGATLQTGTVNGGLDVDQVNASGNLRNLVFTGVEILNTGGATITASAAQMEAFDTIRHSAATPDAGVILRLSAAGTINLVGELGTRAVNFTGSAGNDVISTGGGVDIINGGAGDDTLHAGAGNDTIQQVAGEGHDIVRGGGGADNYILLGTAEAETFRIMTRAEAVTAGITGLDALTEIVITRNGTDNASVVAELDDIEEIFIDSFNPTANNGNGVVDGGASGADTVIVVGDFAGTSLNYSTIHINGTAGGDTIDISGLTSDHRVVFTSNGGADTVIGTPRPQDVFEGISAADARTGMLAETMLLDEPFAGDGLVAMIGSPARGEMFDLGLVLGGSIRGHGLRTDLGHLGQDDVMDPLDFFDSGLGARAEVAGAALVEHMNEQVPLGFDGLQGPLQLAGFDHATAPEHRFGLITHYNMLPV